MTSQLQEYDIWKVLSKRWTLPILKNMSARGIIRFGELKKALAGVSSTVLSERLLELEREGLVAKRVYGAPPRVEYSLTASARELEAIMAELGSWYVRRKAGSAIP